MTRLPVPASGSYRRMGEGLGARPQALLNAGPVHAVPCPGGGRGYAPFDFHPYGPDFPIFFGLLSQIVAYLHGPGSPNVAAHSGHIAWPGTGWV